MGSGHALLEARAGATAAAAVLAGAAGGAGKPVVLLETWVVAVRPDLDERDPRFVLNAYERFRAQRGFPVHLPLSHSLDARATAARLGEFRAALEVELRPPNPFEQSEQ